MNAVLVLPGYGGAETALGGFSLLTMRLDGAVWLKENVGISQAREAFAAISRTGSTPAVLGLGAGCVQALLLAQAYRVPRIACVMPGADGRKGSPLERFIARVNMFAVTAPLLVADTRESPETARLLGSVQGEKQYRSMTGKQLDFDAIVRHLLVRDDA